MAPFAVEIQTPPHPPSSSAMSTSFSLEWLLFEKDNNLLSSIFFLSLRSRAEFLVADKILFYLIEENQ